jgi:outer membrane protein assembly factor BamB
MEINMKIKTHTIMFVLLCSLVQQSLGAQQHNPFGEIKKGDKNSTLNMHLLPEGEFEVSKDQWGDIVRVNMLKIKDWAKVPGVKKAWSMKGYEGVEGMAFHPILSEVKDVDGDGKPDILRCRSEHGGTRIERLRYDDGPVVWESEPLGALFGDETRLPVFDLHGNGHLSVLYASRHDHCGKLWCIRTDTGETEWCAAYGDGAIKNHGNGQGDVIVGHFLDRKTQAVVVRDGGILRCYNHRGAKQWTHDTLLRAGADYAHEIMRCDVDGDGLDEIFANWEKLTMGLRGDGRVLWEDRTQVHHSDFVDYGDVDGDGNIEVIYDHEGCGAAKGPIYVVEPLTGKIKARIDYRKQGVAHAQNIALGNFDRSRKGLEIAFCEKGRDLYLFDGAGTLLWKRPVPASLLSRGDWDGDGIEDIACFALGANVDGMFSVWNGQGERLYAISFLPSPSRRTWSDEHNGGSWSHAMPGGHEGVRRQVDLDGNGRADFIMPFGAWHWGSDAILFLMEGQ